jgi:hypothetical protein
MMKNVILSILSLHSIHYFKSSSSWRTPPSQYAPYKPIICFPSFSYLDQYFLLPYFFPNKGDFFPLLVVSCIPFTKLSPSQIYKLVSYCS